MQQPRLEKALRVSIAISLAIHAIFASVVHPFRVEADEPERPTPMVVIRIIPPTPPPPTPTPSPRKRTPPKAPQHVAATQMMRPRVNLVPTHPGLGPSQARVAPEATGIPQPVESAGTDVAATVQPLPPAPTPTPKPACSAPNVPAKAIDPVTPDEPAFARDEGLAGMAKIRVDLDSSGRVVATSVYASTGSGPLDQAALQAARQTRYAPEQTDCKSVPGSYLFTVEFQSFAGSTSLT